MRATYTKEQRKKAAELRAQGLTVAAIGVAMNIPQTTLYYWLRPRPALAKTAREVSKCPVCGGRLPEIKNIMFCPFCGGDVASPARKTARELDKVLDDISKFYPVDHRDFAVQTINKAIKILKEVG
jgi:transposase-like protein